MCVLSIFRQCIKNIDFICEPQKSLQRLFKASGFPYVNRENIKASDFDYRISFYNLPRLFQTSIDTTPSYLVSSVIVLGFV